MRLVSCVSLLVLCTFGAENLPRVLLVYRRMQVYGDNDKACGAKFSFGSNQHVHGIGEIDWSLNMASECGLVRSDIFLPARKLK
jgi:hypothetical protein